MSAPSPLINATWRNESSGAPSHSKTLPRLLTFSDRNLWDCSGFVNR
jgi:hypothetical protein